MSDPATATTAAIEPTIAPATSRRVFVVAGMHRAGTSVMARALQALGVDLGDRLMSADVRMNARGFFEDLDIVKLDDTLLELAGADWKSIALLGDVDWRTPQYADAAADARALLASRFATNNFGFKDPRVPRLLPFWQQRFAEIGIGDLYVIAVRHPLSVIDSLTARDQLDRRRSGWLWLVHTVCSLRYTAGRPRVIVDYDRMLDTPTRELARIVRHLGLPSKVLDSPGVTLFTEEFLAADLRHARHTEVGPAPDFEPLVAEAHAIVQRAAADDDPIDSVEGAARIATLFEQLRALSPLLDYAGSVEGIADATPRLAGELTWARQSLEDATRYNQSLREAMHDKDRYSNELVAALERKEAELVAAHERLRRVAERWLGRMVLRRIDDER
jgi:hypothetical protein